MHGRGWAWPLPTTLDVLEYISVMREGRAFKVNVKFPGSRPVRGTQGVLAGREGGGGDAGRSV